MGRIEDFIAKLRTVNVDQVNQGVLEVVKKHAAQLIDLNTRQLMRGENAEGGVLGTYRSASYEKLKEYLNPEAGGKVDLRLTGDFQNSFFLEADAWPVNVFARDLKTGKLSEMYEDIFGFSPKSKDEIVADVREEVIDYVQGLLQI